MNSRLVFVVEGPLRSWNRFKFVASPWSGIFDRHPTSYISQNRNFLENAGLLRGTLIQGILWRRIILQRTHFQRVGECIRGSSFKTSRKSTFRYLYLRRVGRRRIQTKGRAGNPLEVQKKGVERAPVIKSACLPGVQLVFTEAIPKSLICHAKIVSCSRTCVTRRDSGGVAS